MKMALRSKILVGIACSIAGYVVFAPPDAQPVGPAKTDASAPAPRSPRRAGTNGQRALHALYLLTHRVSDSASASALFAAHSWYSPPPPPPPVPSMSAAQVAALQVPTAPPLPFAFMGSYTPDGSTPVFFLTQGDRVYDVRIGDTLDATYSVDSFANGQLVLTYKPLKIQQQLSVGGAP
jgi:hypothetical protein